jgi:hypothetical protein
MKRESLLKVPLLLLALVLCGLSTTAFGQSGTVHNGAKIVIEKTGDVTVKAKTGKKTQVQGQFAPLSTKTALTAGATVTVDSTLGN